jgi:hypothetical protein
MAASQGKLHAVIIAVATAFVAACVATVPPRPVMSPWSEDARFGYSDRALDETQIEVNYKTPFTLIRDDPTERSLRVEEVRELANDLALLRAAEIALARGFPALSVVDSKFDTQTEIHTSAGAIPRYGYRHTLGGVRAIERQGPDTRTTWMQGETALRAALKRRADSGDHDAAATAERLRARYEGVMADDN